VKCKISKNVVAAINGLFSPEDFAQYLFLLSLYYNLAEICAENNNHGYTTNLELFRLGAKIYHSKRYDSSQGDVETNKRGFTTNAQTRLPILDTLAKSVRSMDYEIRDSYIIQQMKTFIRPEKNPSHPEADGNFLDDGVIALAITDRLIQEFPYKPIQNFDSKRASLKDDILNKQKNGGFGFARGA
jgi:hypothetical protein